MGSKLRQRGDKLIRLVRRSRAGSWLWKRSPALLRRTARNIRLKNVYSVGKLSIIVPCYRVEQYLSACLKSILRQTYYDIEIVVVIDGSDDNSELIARRMAREDPRLKIIVQHNAGLGAARNKGVQESTGEYIAFVDADDVVPQKGFRSMMRQLTSSNSDFIVGSIHRYEAGREWTPGWARRIHRDNRIGIRIEDFPEALADVIVCNKVFRRDFYHEWVGPFPEGVRYEDQEVTTRAYCKGTFDIVKTVVYVWNVRGDGSSITQGKASMADLEDRMVVMSRALAWLESNARPLVIRAWYIKLATLDLPAYWQQIPRTDVRYWSALHRNCRHFKLRMSESINLSIPVAHRVLFDLVAFSTRDVVVRALTAREIWGDSREIRGFGSDPEVRLAWLDDEMVADIGDVDLSPSGEDLRLTSGILSYGVSTQGIISIQGYAFIRGLAYLPADWKLSAELRCDVLTVRPISVPVKQSRNLAIDDVIDDPSLSYAESGISLEINCNQLYDSAAQYELAVGATWQLLLLVRGPDDSASSEPVTRRHNYGTARMLTPPLPRDKQGLQPTFVPDFGLRLHLRSVPVSARFIEIRNSEFDFWISEEPGMITPGEIVAKNGDQLSLGTFQGAGERVTLRLNVPGDDIATPVRWRIVARTTNQETDVFLSGYRKHWAIAPDAAVVVDAARFGSLRVSKYANWVGVTDVQVDKNGDGLWCSGWMHLKPMVSPRLAFVGDGLRAWVPDELHVEGHSWRAHFSILEDLWGSARVRQFGGRSLRLRDEDEQTIMWVPVSEQLGAQFPKEFVTGHGGIKISRTARAGALWITLQAPLAKRTAGRRGQRDLQFKTFYAPQSDLEDQALFSCYNGREASDAVLQLQKYLAVSLPEVSRVWAVQDWSIATPPGTRKVVVNSQDYYEALSSSRWLVNNNNFPHYFRKQPEQTYIQTWHGTPLKRIGNDVPGASLSLRYRALMEREAGYWDYLLAQNDFAADRLAKAFGYSGRVLNLGYPRNDPLAIASESERVAVRRRLGLTDNQCLLLYTPTWRDDAKTRSGSYRLMNYMDLDVMSQRLGEEWIIGIRGHSNTRGSILSREGVVDFTPYPDVNDLLIAADCLVTDYSSVMFDYVVTGKPIAFLAPDMQSYEESVRGFYLSLTDVAPGPIFQTTESLAEYVATLDDWEMDSRYERFRATYAPLDDGSAARRVGEIIWG